MKKGLEKFETFFLFFAIAIFVFVLILEISSLNKTIHGLKINDIKIGGITRAELQDIILEAKKEYKEIQIKADGSEWTASYEELGLSINTNNSVNDIFSIGREKNIFLGIYTQLHSLLYGYQAKAKIDINKEIFDQFIEKTISKIENPKENASFDLSKEEILIRPEKLGTVTDREKLKNDLIKTLSTLSKERVEAEFIVSLPEISSKDLISIKEEVKKIIENTPYLLEQNGEQKWEIDKSQIKELLEPTKKNDKIQITLNEEKLKNFLIQISPSINRPSKNAVLTIKDGKATEFELSKNGIELEVELSAKQVEYDILTGEKTSKLLTKEVPAEIRTETIENLGILTKIGSGISDFAGSPSARVHNIKIGAAKMNGVLIKPGEEFSFVGNLGGVGPQEGYQPTYVIKNNQTITEYGGGLCQVSTTTFRAAMYAGLKITERFPHSYPVHYYDPQGFDAAIYGPHPDLRFMNDTKGHILIQAYVKGTKLYFDFYGTDDGRKVEIIGPEEYEKKPDGSLKTKLTRKVYDENGEILAEKTFWSSYKSPDLYPIQKNPLE